MNGYVIVICVMLIMFAGLMIVIVQSDSEELQFKEEITEEPEIHFPAEPELVETAFAVPDDPEPIQFEPVAAHEDESPAEPSTHRDSL